MAMASSRHVLVFARLPQPGRVKQRLAAEIGDARAAHIYQACAEHVICEASNVPAAQCTVWYAEPPSSHADVHAWLARALGTQHMPYLVRIEAHSLPSRKTTADTASAV